MGKDESGEWYIHQAGGKHAEGTADVKDGQLHAMFATAKNSTLWVDFNKIGEKEEFLWYQ